MTRVRAFTVNAVDKNEKQRFLDDARAIQAERGWYTMSDAVIYAVNSQAKILDHIIEDAKMRQQNKALVAQRDALLDAANGLYDTIQDLRHVINGVLAGEELDDSLDAVMTRGRANIKRYRATLALSQTE